ncbi:MAG TPA: hypothetical protein VGI80_04805 [Pyrinomonadaceae bacterium]
MIAPPEFETLVATYIQHGWLLRRVVLQNTADVAEGLTPDISVRQSIIDAAWFSRPPNAGPIAWEIRYLGPTQYALVEHLDEAATDFEEKLHQTEQRLADAVNAKQTA